jgi:hypothetical protein
MNQNSSYFGEIRAGKNYNDAGDMSSITGTHVMYTDDWMGDESGASSGAPVIFGRNKETATLLQIFQKLRQTNESQVVLVHGESGAERQLS